MRGTAGSPDSELDWLAVNTWRLTAPERPAGDSDADLDEDAELGGVDDVDFEDELAGKELDDDELDDDEVDDELDDDELDDLDDEDEDDEDDDDEFDDDLDDELIDLDDEYDTTDEEERHGPGPRRYDE
jgi:ribonuclease E